MSTYAYNPTSLRRAKARWAMRLGPSLRRILTVLAVVLLAAGTLMTIIGLHLGISLTGLGISLGVIEIWLERDIASLQPAPAATSTQLDQLLPPSLLSGYRPNLTAAEFWTLLAKTPDANFLLLRYQLDPTKIASVMAGWQLDHQALWTETARLAAALEQPTLTAGLAFCALFNLNPQLTNLLTEAKLSPDDLAEGVRWLSRLEVHLHRKRPIYGGVARDWASGFTPLLAQYGTNLSQQVEFTGGFGPEERTTQLDSLVTGLESATGSVILVGEPGIGKSALLIGLADRLLQGAHGPLAHHQIYALNASLILSNVEGEGDIERIVLALFNEAARAGNIVLALDEAQLFFGQGTGAVNLSQVLLPILQTRALKLVLAVSPGDWQKLRATNTAMASLLTPLVLTEPSQTNVMRLLADRALLFERGQYITTWNALTEAYHLSGRYFEDEAYPGRALKLLEAAYSAPDGNFITAKSVEQTIESQLGVKVQQAGGTESDTLLHLEDEIHKRMINQSRAVSVVAAALRRARAGVANPKRPIGSFLFLGPTGVGKTELARSLAATYFGSENNIVRLDMSEYQQIPDVDRILEPADLNPDGLLPRVRQNPFSVILFDEIEKAHPNILNLFLQLLDEGNLTDTAGHATSFKDAVLIATSNAGADEIRQRIEAGQELESFEQQFTTDLIDYGIFKPELLNRFDEIVLFRPLNESELGQVVKLMMAEVNHTLAPQKIAVQLTDEAAAHLVATGYDPRLGARPMRRMVTRQVEDAVADMILKGTAKPGDTITLGAEHLAETPSPSPDAATEPEPPPDPTTN